MNIEKNVNYIFDFDGTIVELHINWNALKQEINDICKQFGVETTQSLNVKIDELKNETNVLDIVKKFEQANNKVSYNQKYQTIKFIETLNEFYIISNNLSSTILQVIEELNLQNKCKKIIAIDNVKKSKPSIEGFLNLRKNLKYEDSVYIGDSDIDRIFAKNCKIRFIGVEEI